MVLAILTLAFFWTGKISYIWDKQAIIKVAIPQKLDFQRLKVVKKVVFVTFVLSFATFVLVTLHIFAVPLQCENEASIGQAVGNIPTQALTQAIIH